MSDPADLPIHLGGLGVKSKNFAQKLQYYSYNYTINYANFVKI